MNFDGTGQFKFALVNADGTTTYWSNDGTSTAGSEPAAAIPLTVAKGLYSVMLGDSSIAGMAAIPASVWTNADVRLRVWFNDGTNGSQLLSPDQRLAPNGYLPDGAVTSAKLADGSVGSTHIAAGAITSAQLAAGTMSAPVSIAGTTQAAAANTSYVATSSSMTTIELTDATANVGDVVQITGAGAGGWTANVTDPNQFSPHESNRYWASIASSADGMKLVAVTTSTTGGKIYTSTDAGMTWAPHESDRYWAAVASSADGTKLVAAVYGGQIYTSTDSGANWTPNDSDRGWYAVASSADGTKLVAAEWPGKIYTSTDSGANWTPRESDRDWISVASSADGTKLIAADVNGADYNGGLLYTSTDSGVTWTARATPRSWTGVASSADGTKLVATTNGEQVYTSTDSGETWTAHGDSQNWYATASSADGSRQVAAPYPGQIYIRPTVTAVAAGGQGTSATLQYLGSGQWASVAQTQIAIGAVGSAQLAAGAVGSTQLAAGTMSAPVSIAGSTQAAAANASYVATSASPTTIVLPSTANVGDVVQITGAGAGGWMATGNDPNAFTARESNRNWYSVASSADGSKLAAVASGGQIYTSTDSGVSWMARESNRNWYSVASSADGSKLVAVVEGGQIYTSTDSGVSWTARESNRYWWSVASSADGSKLAAVEVGGQIYTSVVSGPVVSGAQGTNATLQYLGGGQWAQVSEAGMWSKSGSDLSYLAGKVGIGRTPVTNRLEVEGDASKTTASSWLANSDRRIKMEIATIPDALATLGRVRPVTFRYTEEYRRAHPDIRDERYFNVIAQEFREVFPTAVRGSGERLADGSEILQVDTYPALITTIAAVNELNAKLETALRAKDAEITALKRQLAERDRAIEARLSRLEQRAPAAAALPVKAVFAK